MRIEREGRSFEVREIGSGPTIVLVHGYPLDGGMWSGVARLLAAGFRVVKPDLPGRPENPLDPHGTMESYADFLQAVVEGAGSPVGIAGFSMGGYATFALLARRPQAVRAVAFVATKATADDDAGRKKRDDAIEAIRTRGAVAACEAMIDKLLSPEALRKTDVAERVKRMILRQKPETLISDLTAMRDREDRTALLPALGIPALVLASELDVIIPPGPAQEMATAIPGSRFVSVPGAGHAIPIERPKAVGAALGDFFREALPA
jgi:pimeloyl-ACP methyl ester carboxylesterase